MLLHGCYCNNDKRRGRETSHDVLQSSGLCASYHPYFVLLCCLPRMTTDSPFMQATSAARGICLVTFSFGVEQGAARSTSGFMRQSNEAGVDVPGTQPGHILLAARAAYTKRTRTDT